MDNVHSFQYKKGVGLRLTYVINTVTRSLKISYNDFAYEVNITPKKLKIYQQGLIFINEQDARSLENIGVSLQYLFDTKDLSDIYPSCKLEVPLGKSLWI